MKNTSETFEQARILWDLERVYADFSLAKRERLTPTEKEYLRALLLSQSPMEIAKALNKSVEGVRVALTVLYRYAEALLNLPVKTVDSKNFVTLLAGAEYKRLPHGSWPLTSDRRIQLSPETANLVATESRAERQLTSLTRVTIPQGAGTEPEIPEGQVDLASNFYVERSPIESRCYQTILKPGALIRIKAPRQMGKTSLLARILHQAERSGCHTVPLSFQLTDTTLFSDLDRFLKWFCVNVTRALQLPNQVAEYWDELFGSNVNCKAYFEQYLLAQIDRPLVLGLDEVDRVFQYPEIADDFFRLLRAWHEEGKNREIWKKLRLIVVHSTEVYIPLDINQSPFNVGLPIELPELTPEQVYDLVQRHQLDLENTQIDRLMSWVGGHPYLIRIALYHLACQNLTMDPLLQLAPTEAGVYGNHLRRQLWNLEQQPDLLAALKTVIAANTAVRIPAVHAFKLQSMGLVRLCGNDVAPRCHLYCHYFRDRLGLLASTEPPSSG